MQIDDKPRRIREEREPLGWRGGDELMESIYRERQTIPFGGVFLVWYIVVLIGKELHRLIWVARWRWFRRKLQPHASPAADRLPPPGP